MGKQYGALGMALAIGSIGLTGSPANALSVTVNSGGTGSLGTLASDASGGSVSEWVGHAGLPYTYSSTSIDASASSIGNYDLSDTGFIITLTQARSSATSSLAQGAGDVYFSVDQDATYTAFGSYLVTDAAGRRVYLQAFLYDLTTSSYAFNQVQESRVTPNQNFTLGLSAGDYANGGTGSLSGALTAGHDYRFYYQAFTQANVSGASAASASGSFFLDFAPVPEPSTALLVGVGLASLATRSRKRARE